ncbi:MAG: mechanosensitive ion channel [Helicobacteraceae bacterium]|jgi:small-conductance mechanosensitive channel|nr:mechanosensitive ion channel [Helicobacteraceae bacterium]
MGEWIDKIWEYLNYVFLDIGDAHISALGIFKFVFVFWFGFFLGRLFRRRIASLSQLTRENRQLISSIGYYAIVIGAIFIGLSALGVNLSALAVIAGAISVGVGFGLQNIVSNFVSGIILLFEKTIRVGDLIELPTKERGWVRQINMRSTAIITSDNIEIIVPNQTFITQNIVNLSFSDGVRRIIIPFSVAYGSIIDEVKRVVIAKVESSDLKYERSKPLSARLVSLGDSALNFVLVVYIGTGINDPVPYDYDFLPLIYDALNEANIAIPFPQLDLRVKTETS